MTNILDVQGLETRFRTNDGYVHAVNGVSFSLEEGETLGIVGESGSGKSVTVLSMLRLIPSPPGKVVAGKALFMNRDLLEMPQPEIRHILGAQISMVFQDPMTSFNPVLTIGRQLTEPLEIHMNISKAAARDRAVEILDMVGIPKARERMGDYPHQFSGGMRQRVMIAMALVCGPQILIADEPTTALDVTIQAQIVDMVKQLRDEMGMAIIWITHDMGIIAGLAQRVLVMYGGLIVEETPVVELYTNPRHPYTLALLASLPRLDEMGHRRLLSIDGMPPVLLEKPTFCPFAYRCRYVFERCWQENPPLQPISEGQTASSRHAVACWLDPDLLEVHR